MGLLTPQKVILKEQVSNMALFGYVLLFPFKTFFAVMSMRQVDGTPTPLISELPRQMNVNASMEKAS